MAAVSRTTFPVALCPAAATLLGLVVRLAFLGQNIRYDEAVTFNRYVTPPGAMLHYTAPNNHLFHTVLVWLSTFLFGPELWAIRLPALLAGVAAIPLTWQLCRELNDDQGGELAALGMAVFPFLVLFSTNARGYTLLTCFTLLTAIAIVRILKHPESGSTLWVSLFTTLGLWTVPSMAYPAAGLILWLFIELYGKTASVIDTSRRFLLPLVIQILSFTLLLYAPTLLEPNGFNELFRNQTIKPLANDAFFAGISAHFADVYRHLFRDVPVAIRLWTLMLLITGAARLLCRRKTYGATFLIAVLLGTGTLFLIKQSFPFTRSWIFVIPLVLIHADIGFTWLATKLPDRLAFIPPFILIASGCVFSWGLVRNDRISAYNDTGRFPEVAEVVEFLLPVLREGDVVVAYVPNNEPLQYYLRHKGKTITLSTALVPGVCNYVIDRRDDDRGISTQGLKAIFTSGEATIYVVSKS